MNLRNVVAVLFFVGSMVALPQATRAQSEASLTVGPYLLNTESAFTTSAQTYSSSFTLPASARLVVSYAPQYFSDFGIIQTAHLSAWKLGRTVPYLFRLTGVTAVRYIALPAGSYTVVARNRTSVAFNGFSIKVRRFKKKVVDDGVTRTFVSNKTAGIAIPPNKWNGMGFKILEGYSGWLEGVFSRGVGRNVRYHLLTEAEYRRFVSGLSFTSLVQSSEPESLGFEVNLTPGKYFLVVLNREPSYSSLAITRELYQ